MSMRSSANSRLLVKNVVGLHSGSITDPRLGPNVVQEWHNRVLTEKKPSIGNEMPYISPFTGTPRVFRVDLYPIFDGGGNISGFGSYGMDYLDQYSRPGLEALRPQLQALDSIKQTVQTVISRSSRPSLAATVRESLGQGIAALTSPYLDALEQDSPTVDCYLGGIILRVVGTFGDLVHQMSDPNLSLDPYVTQSSPVVSLQINPECDFLCHCDESYFELALWHALQCPFSDEDVAVVDVLIENDEKTKDLVINIVWKFKETHSDQMREHLVGVKENAQRGGLKATWTKIPRSKITLTVPPYKYPFVRAPKWDVRELTGKPPEDSSSSRQNSDASTSSISPSIAPTPSPITPYPATPIQFDLIDDGALKKRGEKRLRDQ